MVGSIHLVGVAFNYGPVGISSLSLHRRTRVIYLTYNVI